VVLFGAVVVLAGVVEILEEVLATMHPEN